MPAFGSLVLPLLSLSTLYATAPVISTVGANHSRWTSASGFPGGHVYAITQTSDGYLWIGSSNGLLRFDGMNFIPFHSDAVELPVNPSVAGLATDADGHLWASNGLQMFLFADGKLKNGLPEKGPQPMQDIVIAKAQTGALLFAAGLEGISSYAHGRLHLLCEPGQVTSVAVSLAQSADGILWIGTKTGLFLVDPRTGTRSVRRIEGLPEAKVNTLLQARGGVLLIGTDKGLWSWESGTVASLEVASEIAGRQILALASDLDGNTWVGTESGLYKTNVNRISGIPKLQLLEKLTATATVTSLYADREGNMWVGGLEGIERYRGNAFITYSVTSRAPSENSGPLYVDHEARTWFAPSEGGLYWFRRNEAVALNSAGWQADGVYSIAGGNGEVWVGRKHGGLTRLRPNGKSADAVTFTERQGLAENAVYSVHRSADGTVWAGTLSRGLSRLQHGKLKTFTVADGLPSNTISAIADGGPGGIFVGTPNGIGELRDGRWTTYTASDGLPPGAVDSLLTDNTGTLWIGTTKGIAFFRSGTIQVPVTLPNALSEEILGIAESGGWLWMTTPNHVLRVRRDALRTGALQESDYREYGEPEGLASVEGVKRNRSVVADERGQVWFSLNRGISVMQPSILGKQSTPPLIHLERMLVDEKPMPVGTRTRVPTGTHRVTFHFASVSLTNPERIRYRYRLDDFDSTWSEPTTISEANYTNLPPGGFRFRVMARNADGLWSAGESGVTFEVEPAYWQARWFQFACIAALFLAAFGLYRLRVLQLTRSLHLLFEERLAERSRIGRELHDTLLQNLTGLALQISGLAKIVKEPQRAAEGLQQLKRQAEDCVRETRKSVWDIRSADADIHDLPAALKDSGQQLTAGKPMQFHFACQGAPCELPSQVRQHLLRIAREAIGNAVRHAAPTEIALKLNFGLREVQLVVSDNGGGFDFATMQGMPGHFGLATMKERASQIRASIQVTSTAGQGTVIAVRVPRKVLTAID